MANRRNAVVGELRERATFQAWSTVSSAYANVLSPAADVWCRVAQPSGQMAQQGPAGVVQRRYTVTARYRSEIDTASRIIWRGKTLEIVEGANPDEHRQYLTFSTRESMATALQREIDTRGFSVTYSRPVNASPVDASKPWVVVAGTTLTVSTKAIIEAQTTQMDGSDVPHLMQTVTVFVILASNDAIAGTPLPGDRIAYGSRTMVVETVTRVSPMDPVLAWSLSCRE